MTAGKPPDARDDDDAPAVIDDDPDHPQLVDAFATREAAEARALAIKRAHGHQPFMAAIRDGSGEASERLVTAEAVPTTTGR